MPVGWTRRRFGRLLGVAATATAAGSGLAACGPTTTAALPSVTAPTTTLIAQVSWQGSGVPYKTAQPLVEEFIQKNWSAQHPGVRVVTQGWGAAGFDGLPAILAGQGPDIIMNCCGTVPQIIDAKVLRPLDPYLKRDNIDVASLFPASVLQSMRTPEALYGLPDYGSTQPLFYNQSMLDGLGLTYPTDTWTHTEAAQLWTAVAGKRKGKWVYGANLVVGEGHNGGSAGAQEWLIRGFGGTVRDPTHTICKLDSPEAVAAYSWLAPLCASNIIYPGLWGLGNTPDLILRGQVGFSPACCGTLLYAAVHLNAAIKWDLVAMPVFPAGRTCFIGNGMYGMNALSSHDPDLVWDLFRWITTSADWQRYFNATLSLQPPSLLSDEVWSDWLKIVRQAAPPLKNKNLEAYHISLKGAYDWAFFKYAPTQADALWAKYTALMTSGQMSVELALGQLTNQINALEAAGQQMQVAQEGANKAFPSVGPAIAGVQPGL